jgi:hypothetical protein
VAGLEFDSSWRLQRDRLQELLKMFVALLSGFKDTKGEVESMRISLESQKKLLRCWRAVNTIHVISTWQMGTEGGLQRCFERLKPSQMVTMDMA